jgi:IclR family acetate operon transcriptional repressor
MKRSRSGRGKDSISRASYDVAVLGKALELLEALARNKELGLSELTGRTGVSKPSAFRILSTLENRGYLAKDGVHRKYRPGPRLIALSGLIVSGVSVVQHARSVMEALRSEFGETVNLGALGEKRVLYLDILESQHGLRMAARVGAQDCLHSTALGKAILAALPSDEVDQLLKDYQWERRTRHTITTRAPLERELVAVRERGYAVDDQENEEGARCVGVAVLGPRGLPIAALSVSGPATRLSEPVIRRIGDRLKRAAREIEERMGLQTAHVRE